MNIDEIRAKLKRGEYPVTGLACDAIRALCDEVKRLQNIVDVYAASARTTALYLQPFCDGSIPYADMIADASRKADKRITELEKETAVLKRALEEYKNAYPDFYEIAIHNAKIGNEQAREEMEK